MSPSTCQDINASKKLKTTYHMFTVHVFPVWGMVAPAATGVIPSCFWHRNKWAWCPRKRALLESWMISKTHYWHLLDEAADCSKNFNDQTYPWLFRFNKECKDQEGETHSIWITTPLLNHNPCPNKDKSRHIFQLTYSAPSKLYTSLNVNIYSSHQINNQIKSKQTKKTKPRIINVWPYQVTLNHPKSTYLGWLFSKQMSLVVGK